MKKNSPTSSFPRQAILLAAGLGTRLRPLTFQMAKPGLPVGGVPILLFNLYLLKKAGIGRITINLHHLPERLKKILADFRPLGLTLQFSMEKNILGTAGGIAQALEKMDNETTVVLNGDVICDLDLGKMFLTHRNSGAEATLACVSPNRAKVKSFVEFDHQGRIVRIAGKPRLKRFSGRRAGALKKGVFSGAHILEPELFRDYPRRTYGCVIRQVYQPALARGLNLQAHHHGGLWWDLGNLAEIKKVDEGFWRSRFSPKFLEFWREVFAWSEPLFHHS